MLVKIIKKDMDGELRTTSKLTGRRHQSAGKDNVADRGPGQSIGRAETKFEKPKTAGAGADGESIPSE